MLSKLFGRKQREQVPPFVLERALRDVARELPGLNWAAIVSVDGLIQEMYGPFGKIDPDRASAMAVAAHSLGERISRELRHGQLNYSIIAGDDGIFVAHSVGKTHILAVSLPVGTEIDTTIDALAQAVATLTSTYYQGEE
jgi:predicted regulator of Ras-like GTPase activity (Roadblock/LC7/MglB family)